MFVATDVECGREGKHSPRRKGEPRRQVCGKEGEQLREYRFVWKDVEVRQVL